MPSYEEVMRGAKVPTTRIEDMTSLQRAEHRRHYGALAHLPRMSFSTERTSDPDVVGGVDSLAKVAAVAAKSARRGDFYGKTKDPKLRLGFGEAAVAPRAKAASRTKHHFILETDRLHAEHRSMAQPVRVDVEGSLRHVERLVGASSATAGSQVRVTRSSRSDWMCTRVRYEVAATSKASERSPGAGPTRLLAKVLRVGRAVSRPFTFDFLTETLSAMLDPVDPTSGDDGARAS